INQELQENPALDLEEVQACPLCGQPLTGRVCLHCFGTGKGPYKGSEDLETEPLEGTSLMQRDEEEDELDPIVRAEAEQTLAEYLSWNTRVLLPKRLHAVAEYIIGNLNDFGYLEMALEDVAKTMKVSLADATEVLKTIQGIEPWGIGGRQVALRPDVIIVRNEKGEFEVEVIESRRFSLRVNPVYRQLVGQLQAARSAGAAAPPMTDDERQHIRQYVTRAKFFIDNINQRRQTIGRITDVIVDCQKDFLEKGVQSLRPLTRAEVGERIGMHESTVSRASAGKFVLVPG